MILTGMTQTEMCKSLGIQESTLRNHMHAIYRITGASDRFTAFVKLYRAHLEQAANEPPRRCYRCSALVFRPFWEAHETECLRRCAESDRLRAVV